MQKKDTQLVLQHCANYTVGYICSGAMIDKNLNQWIDEELYNKPCLVKEGGECGYFNKFVKPEIQSL